MGNNESTNDTAAKYNGWMRVQIALEIHLKNALLRVFHNDDADPNFAGFCRNEVTLHSEMCNFKLANSAKLAKVITGKQWDILCPVSHKTDTSKIDITLLFAVIRNVIKPPPVNGWKLPVTPGDQTTASFCLKAKELRNKVKHGNMDDIVTEVEFQSCWKDMYDILIGLNYNELTAFNDLKDGPIDRHTTTIISTLEKKIMSITKESSERNTEMSSLKESVSNQTHLIVDVVESLSDLLMYLKGKQSTPNAY